MTFATVMGGGAPATVGAGVGFGVGGTGVGAGVEKHVSVTSSEKGRKLADGESSLHTPMAIPGIGVGAPFAMEQFASRKACCVGASQLPSIMEATVPLGMLGSSRSDLHVPAGMVTTTKLSPVQLALLSNTVTVMLYAGVGAGVGAGVSAHEPMRVEMQYPPELVQHAPWLFPEQSEAQPAPLQYPPVSRHVGAGAGVGTPAHAVDWRVASSCSAHTAAAMGPMLPRLPT
jgi:hypothetical protein